MTNVHILVIGGREPSAAYFDFIREMTDCKVFFYRDTRASRVYIPSLRPNALKQHYAAFPELEGEVVFYHDADIIFRELPDFEKLCNDDIFYLSDTNSYINADYINQKGEGLLQEMCSVVGVSVQAVEAINKDSGGAQYLLKKGINAFFWAKVEKDCESLYRYMNESVPHWAEKWAKQMGQDKGSYHPIQAWTADMWCVLWNILLSGGNVKVHAELAFSWATDSLESYRKKKIFHNAGVTDGDKEKLFFKGQFINASPIGLDLSYVDRKSASSAYVQAINDYVESQVKEVLLHD